MQLLFSQIERILQMTFYGVHCRALIGVRLIKVEHAIQGWVLDDAAGVPPTANQVGDLFEVIDGDAVVIRPVLGGDRETRGARAQFVFRRISEAATTILP